MPSFLRDVTLHNLVLNDEAITHLHKTFLQRVTLHNASKENGEEKLTPVYVVRFDNRGYRTFSADEAWDYYTSANKIERVVLQADSHIGLNSNRMAGEHIEIKLDGDSNATSHLIVGGDSKDWVEATFTSLEEVLARRRSRAASLIRTQWMLLAIQLIGVLVGLLLCLWLATLTSPYLTNIEYPRALSFAFWFLVYSNLWGYIQKQALNGIGTIFPNVRFNRKDEHWTEVFIRKGVETSSIAVLLWGLAWLTKWAASVIAPFITLN